MKKGRTDKKYITFMITMGVILVILFFVSLCLGRFSKISFFQAIKIFFEGVFRGFSTEGADLSTSVVLRLRLPRILAAIIIGAALALSGASYQSLFANPMASPDTLGVTSGASLGACLGILLGWTGLLIETSAFVIGCATVLVSYTIAMALSKGRNSTVFLILTGMVISAFLSSMLSIIKYVADPDDQLPAITFWLMGSLSSVKMTDVNIQLLFFLVGAVPLLLLRWRINVLSLNYFEAKAMGVNVNLLRTITIFCSTLLTASSVAVSGGVSWVGLVIPHIVRIIVGNDCRKLFPATALMGSVYLLIMDNLARTLTPSEIPIGVLTSLIGAPIFFIILIRNKRGMINES